MEQTLKNLLGEYAFQLCALQTLLAEAQKQIAELTKAKEAENTVQ